MENLVFPNEIKTKLMKMSQLMNIFYVCSRLCPSLLKVKVWTVLRGNWEDQSKKAQHTNLRPDTYYQDTPKV